MRRRRERTGEVRIEAGEEARGLSQNYKAWRHQAKRHNCVYVYHRGREGPAIDHVCLLA